MNPFLAFNLYVSARVFVQYLKSRKDDSAIKSSLHFLLAAMQVLKTKNPLTESFLVQLDVDLEGSGLDVSSHSRYKFGQRPPGEVPANIDAIRCSPLFEIRDSQTVGQTSRENGGDSTDQPILSRNGSNPSYPGMMFNQPPTMAEETRNAQIMGDLQPVTSSFEGHDGPFGLQTGFPSQQKGRPSPGFAATDSNTSHSNQPTPGSSSARQGSSTKSPYQQSENAFTPANSGTADRAFPEQIVFGSHGGANIGTVPTNMASGWNMKSHFGTAPQQQPQLQRQTQQQQQPQPNDFGFGGTGLTPGATGMTPLPDSLWQSVMEGGGDWMQGWSPSVQ